MNTARNDKITEIIEKIKLKSEPVFSSFGVRKAGLFGSTVRGENNQASDIDIVVEFSSSADAKDIYQIVRLKNSLSEALGRDVDLSIYSNLRKRLKPFILAEQIIIYDEKK